MTKCIRFFVTALVVMLSMASATSMATASRGFNIEPTAITGTDPSSTFGSESGNIICPLTLEGSLHRTIAKTDGTLAGFITRGRVGEASCTDTIESATVQGELGEGRFPWHVRFRSFSGTLPNIEQIQGTVVSNFTLTVRTIFGTTRCRYVGTMTLAVTISAGTATRIGTTGAVTTAQGFPCPARGEIRSNFTLRPQPRVTLI